MDNTQKFSGKAEAYSCGRPHYAEGLFEVLAEDYGFKGREIADFGCGTGIFAEGLLSHGSIVYGVEPNVDMLAAAEKALANDRNFHATDGSAEYSGLKSGSVYAVTAAQAFHWFDAEKFRAECNRIMYGNYVALAYNRRTQTDLHAAIAQVNSRFCPSFKGFHGGFTDNRVSAFFGGDFRTYTFANNLQMNSEEFLMRCLSSSYAPRKGDGAYNEYISAMRELFAKYSSDGVLDYPIQSKLFIGKIR